MKKKESEGFFCVFYLKEEKKTMWYSKVWKPSTVAEYLDKQNKPWLWIKSYIHKNDYYSNPKGNNYYAIFDKDHPVRDFTFQPFTKNKIG